ncbi:hypothetical protein ACETQG_07440 [Weissella cibaria]|uniref:hypothetical protein n=1 Tax=Weissella cibaria TaxID=137591 RepID=UPI0035BC624F
MTSAPNTNGAVNANMVGTFKGQGDTPIIMTVGTGAPVGYNDDGTAILLDIDERAVQETQKKFMAELIAKNKIISEMNGINKDTVNGGIA